MKELKIEDQIHLCKYHDVDPQIHQYLKISKDTMNKLLQKFKENGLYKQYREMDEFEYDKICKQEKAKKKTENKIKEMEPKIKKLDISTTTVTVPLKLVCDYYYLKGWKDGITIDWNE